MLLDGSGLMIEMIFRRNVLSHICLLIHNEKLMMDMAKFLMRNQGMHHIIFLRIVNLICTSS
jgi:hypothetical protein